MPQSHAPLLVLMIAAGFAVPVMAAINASLGRSLGSPLLAVAVLCAVASCTTICLLLAGSSTLSIRTWPANTVSYLGGVLFVLYIGSITYSAPRIGLGNAVFLVLLGQLACAALIDHFGWFGTVTSPITGKRALGLGFMAIGVYLARAEPQG
ncbi:MAG: DMT family transporter [Pseudomonadota bacterium]